MLLKMRTGFVSNSSSSSFIIAREHISDEQMERLQKHIHWEKYPVFCQMNMDGKGDMWDEWRITEQDGDVKGYTDMDNFPMKDFLKDLGIDMEVVEWY